MKVNQYGLKLLIEGIEDIPDSGFANSDEKIFEEVIVLVNASNENEAKMKIRRHYHEVSYENANGCLVTLRLVRILDAFELIDDIEGLNDFIEVYSRHLIVDDWMNVDAVIQEFSLDK